MTSVSLIAIVMSIQTLQIIGLILSLIFCPLLIHFLYTRWKERSTGYWDRTEQLREKYRDEQEGRITRE